GADIYSAPVSVTGFTQPQNGTATRKSTNPESGDYNVLIYTVTVNNFVGQDTFEYTIQDNTGLTDTALVTVSVEPTPHPPVAVDDVYNVNQDTVLNVPSAGILSNDSDADAGTTLRVD